MWSGYCFCPHPFAVMKQNFSFPLGFSAQLRLAVPCNTELLLQHRFTVERCSLLHLDKFSCSPHTIFPPSVSQVLARWLRNVSWFLPCPKRASAYAVFLEVFLFSHVPSSNCDWTFLDSHMGIGKVESITTDQMWQLVSVLDWNYCDDAHKEDSRSVAVPLFPVLPSDQAGILYMID